MEKVNSFTSSSPRVPPWSPSSHGRWALRPTRAAHSPVQMWPDLSAANFVNESSPVIDSFLLLLAMVERHCSLHRVLRSSHHWRGSVAHNASNFLKSASRLRVFVLGRTITQKIPPLLCLCYMESCQIADTFSEDLPTFVMSQPLSTFVRSEARKIFVPTTWERNLEHMQTNIHATTLCKCKRSPLQLQGYITSHTPKCKCTTGSILE